MPPNPEIDFNLIWQALNGVTSTIQGFFQGIWEQVSNITNVGQGLLAGLVNFATFLWDSIIKFGEWIWRAATEAFGQLGEHIVRAFEYIRSAFFALGEWFYSGLQEAARRLKEAFEFVRDVLVNIGHMILQALITVWNVIYKTFSGLAQVLQDWWRGLTQSINQWWTSTILGVRQKLKQSIGASISITLAWKNAERFVEKVSEANSLRSIFGAFISIPASIFIGYTIAEFIDTLIPTQAAAEFQLIPTPPTFSYTPPALEIPRLEEFKAIREEIGEYVAVEVRKPIG